ncbi:MAG: sigma-70 family RNA polymerase sigma factor [Dysosmobacter sp.]|nr:sigma-70 family RNA polymerase sigma factor [Dysosmobacter sp.]
MAEKEKYYIRIPKKPLIEVTEEVYRAYYQEDRYSRTIVEKDQRNGLASYDELDTVELSGQEMIPDRTAASVEDAAIFCIMRSKLRRCLSLLEESDRELILALYFEGMSERAYSAEAGLHHMTVHNRKVRLLRQLKKMMEN